MKIKKGYATAPAPLSSIFSPKLFKNDEKRNRIEEIGARGGGFTIRKGVETHVEYYPGEDRAVEIYVNDVKMNFITSLKAVEIARKMLGLNGRIVIKHKIHVPIGTGFGTSASAALTTLLTLFKIGGRGITLQEACRITHEIEVECKTGLNSEAGFLSEGLILVLNEGSPPFVKVNSIPIPHGSAIVAVVAAPLDTSNVLSKLDELRRIENFGDKRLQEILKEPTPENFLKQAREFAWEAGFVTARVQEMFEEFEKLPVIGYAQNMIGEACHALVLPDRVKEVEARLKEVFPSYRIVVSEVNGLIRSSTLT